MTRETTDLFVAGAGVAGLTAALALGRAGHRVILADPAPQSVASPKDQRVTAFLQPSQRLFADLGVWDSLADQATALKVLQLADSAGEPPAVNTSRTFRAEDLGDGPFGWSLPNGTVRQTLLAALGALPNVSVRWDTGFRDVLARDDQALITLSDGTRIGAKLAVGADGGQSRVRAAAGIGVRETRYGQKAMVVDVTHSAPHDGVSVEIYRSGGACTLVPRGDIDGKPASAIVWMEDGPKARDLMALDDDAFGAAVTERSCSVFGPLTVASPRAVWPVVLRQADQLTARRVALIAEAAHQLPPIGAQGLNTSLADVASLVLASENAEPGSAEMLRCYAADRKKDIKLRAGAVDILNRVCRSKVAPVVALRRAGLSAVADIAPIRLKAMQMGLGV